MSKQISGKDFVVTQVTGDDLIDAQAQKRKRGLLGEAANKKIRQKLFENRQK